MASSVHLAFEEEVFKELLPLQTRVNVLANTAAKIIDALEKDGSIVNFSGGSSSKGSSSLSGESKNCLYKVLEDEASVLIDLYQETSLSGQVENTFRM